MSAHQLISVEVGLQLIGSVPRAFRFFNALHAFDAVYFGLQVSPGPHLITFRGTKR